MPQPRKTQAKHDYTCVGPMLRLLLAVLLLSFPASATQHVPGAEQPVSPPVRGVNDGSVHAAAVTDDGFALLVQTGTRIRLAELAPLETEARGEPALLEIPYLARVAGLAGGIVTAWMDGRKLFSSVSRTAGDFSSRRELPVHADQWWLHGVYTNGTRALVLASDSPPRTHAWASLLDANGVPVAVDLEVVRPGTVQAAAGFAVGADPGGFLVLYRDNEKAELRGTRIANDGTTTMFAVPLPIGRRAIPVAETYLAFDGKQYLIAFHHQRLVSLLFLAPDGAPRSDFLLFFDSDCHLTGLVSRPGGSLFVCAGKTFTFDHATRTRGVPYPIASTAGFVVSDGVHALVTYLNDHQNYPPGVSSGQWLDVQTGRPLSSSFPLSFGSRAQRGPSLALGESTDLLVWVEGDGAAVTGGAIRGVRIARNGRILDQPPLVLSTPGTRNDLPAVTFNGRDFVVIWLEMAYSPAGTSLQRVRMRGVSQDGRMADREPREIGSTRSWSDTAAAHSGDTTLMLWYETNGSGWPRIAGRRMTRDGILLDADPLRLSQDPAVAQYEMDVAAGGDGFLVVASQRERNLLSLRVARITTAGTISQRTIPQDIFHEANQPRVAWNGSEFLVTTREFASIVTAEGVPSPAVKLPFTGVLDVGFYAGSWTVLYGDWYALEHAFLQRSSLVVEAVLPLAHAPDWHEGRIASDGTRAVLAYTRRIQESPHHGSLRVVFRQYGAPAPPGRRRTARP